ncbi:MAG: hypothetical protein AB1424_11815 [Thermodesulfobacteriota bacterium]
MNLFLLGVFIALALVVLGKSVPRIAGIRWLLTASDNAKIIVVAGRDGLPLILNTAPGKAEK